LGSDDSAEFWLLSKTDLEKGVIGKEPLFIHRLRTVVELSDEVEIPNNELHVPSRDELVKEAARQLIIKGTRSSGDQLMSEAKAALEKQPKDAQQKFTHMVATKLTAERRVPARVAVFQSALNTLIRLYMASFNDPFVEEVSFHQLGGTITAGITKFACRENTADDARPMV
jgi:hypothetical protein